MNKYLLLGVFFTAGIAINLTQSPASWLDFTARSEKAQQTQTQTQESPAEQSPLREALKNAFTNTRSGTREEKQAEIQQRIEERRAEVKEKLSGRRVDSCKLKEKSINHTLTTRTETAKRYLDKFKAVQTNLTTFAADSGLVIDNNQTYIDVLNARYDDAAAIIASSSSTSFDCLETSADNPGEVVKNLVLSSKDALHKYRDALKEYAEVVKAAARAKQGALNE